jgi:hypothetical protein
MFVSPKKKWTWEELRDNPANMAIAAEQVRRDANKAAEPQFRALLAAGWQFEVVNDDDELWQFAWRRPGKRPGKPGRRFASTNQAFNALQRGS